MSAKHRNRNVANAADSATVSLNERILRECHGLYTEPDNGLVTVADAVGLKLTPPRKKIVVMLVGNHSAGKSSFINWYVEEHVQRTGVAIETQGFILVTSGRKRESLTGNATMHLYPHLKPMLEIDGVMDYLATEISTSKQKKFSMLTFIDTPGLVDGDMKYPFDVDRAILWLGELSDLVFVFFDPIGQALCRRTLDLVENLNAQRSDRMRFYLSKADEAGHESDRQRVMMQIVQELCKRPGLNKCGFDMPTIYLPNSNKPTRCANQIEEICREIEKTINHTVQNTLNTLEKDCERIAKQIDTKIAEDDAASRNNFSAKGRGFLIAFMGMLMPATLIAYLVASAAPGMSILKATLGNSTTDNILMYLSPAETIWEAIPRDWQFTAISGLIILMILLLVIARWTSRLKPTLSRKQKRELLRRRDYIQNHVRSRKQTLYQEYLQQSAADQDL